MQKEVTLTLLPNQVENIQLQTQQIAEKLSVEETEIKGFHVLRKSIDARKREIKINLQLQVFLNEEPLQKTIDIHYPFVENSPQVIVVGSGPAGLFAALRLIELGIQPIVFERGKEVKERKKDIAQLNRNTHLDPESNYSFGEGGAGTFSDGKLFTRSKKRGNYRKILEVFHYFGAKHDILINAQPHIGTDKLPTIITNMRNKIIEKGGKIFFNTKVTELIIENKKIKGVKTAQGQIHSAAAVILATGHSARDVYQMLNNQKIALEAKPFAVGVRVEHKQGLINDIQYHCSPYMDYLPSANYTLTSQVNGRGVYSFCMCPGGFVIPASTKENQVVVNGMSPSHRNSEFANSGIVAEIRISDLSQFSQFGVMAGLEFQNHLEELAFKNANDFQKAPAQRLKDFVDGKKSVDLPETSYFPGIVNSEIHQWLPEFIYQSLRKGILQFANKMKGYLTNDALVLGVETRTSSPIKIPRNEETLEHIEIENLYPCGEGAGYAGGIVSSGVDGERCAEKAAEKFLII